MLSLLRFNFVLSSKLLKHILQIRTCNAHANIFPLVVLVFAKLYKQRFLGIGKKIENDENPGERHGFVTLVFLSM
jgi:hypothetical protein